MNSQKDLLQLATYVCPTLSVDYIETLASYIEAQLGIRTTLVYDSRNGGPNSSRGDHKFIDLAFVSTTAYLENYRSKDSAYKLLNVGGVTKHSLKGETLGYFADIIVSRDTKERIKEFFDLRGCSFAYSQETSISSSKQVLLMLKQLGENASFFTNVIAAGNHIKAIELVLAKKAECAAVDSLAYSQFLKHHSYLEPELHLQESWGPLPPHPIIVKKNLPDKIVKEIEDALLKFHEAPGVEEQLMNFGIVRFEKTSPDTYLDALELLSNTKALSIGVTYY